MKTETVILGGGCFWCIEAVFKIVPGVISITPGYAGGTTAFPVYENVCTGNTGHAEVVRVEYDPQKISFRNLLTVFFASHDPTTLNRQGNDVGTQYRSVIYYTLDQQRKEAEKYTHKLQKETPNLDKIITEIKPLTMFYEAEAEHKEYFLKHPESAYCQIVINPKLEKIQKKFAKLLQ
ncbi:MAG: peptide-methionine (S)-S-oxide reductase MsrA [Candidatus Paceibacterota bacterium]|jgi:peptide-methionine (S)-S-oxide reductase